MRSLVDPTAQKKSLLIKLGWIVVLTLFVFSAVAAGVLFIAYKRELKKAEEISMARPIINTFEFPEAQAGKEYKTLIMATVYNFNVKIEGKIVSGLPEGLKLTACQTDFNSPVAKFAAVNSLATCTLEGIPQKSGKYLVEIFFSIPNRLVSAKEIVPLVVNP